jgi:hypothetical protein
MKMVAHAMPRVFEAVFKCTLVLALLAVADAMTRTDAQRELRLRGGGHTDRQLKAAYRKRSLETHPDKGGSTQDFLRVAEAYEVLSGGPAGGQRHEKTAAPTEEELMQRAEDMMDEVLEQFVDGFEQNLDGIVDQLFGGGDPSPGLVTSGLRRAAKWGAHWFADSALDRVDFSELEIDFGSHKVTGRDAADAWREWRETRRKRRAARGGTAAHGEL